jgi:ABC-type glycerol-3-phosphate transport system substrate-binding protein
LDGVAPIPQMMPNNPKTPISRSSFFVSKTSDPQEAIAMWLFIKYLSTNEEFQAEYSMSTGSIPSVKSVFENPIYSEWMSNTNDITASSIKVAYRDINSYFDAPAWLNAPDVRSRIALMISECLTSNWTGDIDALIQEKLNKAVQECKTIK